MGEMAKQMRLKEIEKHFKTVTCPGMTIKDLQGRNLEKKCPFLNKDVKKQEFCLSDCCSPCMGTGELVHWGALTPSANLAFVVFEGTVTVKGIERYMRVYQETMHKELPFFIQYVDGDYLKTLGPD